MMTQEETDLALVVGLFSEVLDLKCQRGDLMEVCRVYEDLILELLDES
jgi:hypothetical protein